MSTSTPPPPSPVASGRSLWLVVALIVLAVFLFFRQPSRSVDIERMPELEVAGWLNTDGPVTRDSLAGQVVLVDCFATWCGPCRQAMPNLVTLRERFADQQVQVIGLTPEDETQIETIENYVASVQGLDWPIGYGAQPTMQVLDAAFLPTYYVFDRTGKLTKVASHLGEAEEAVVQALAQ